MRVAIDCDLRRVHAVDEAGNVLCEAAPDIQAVADAVFMRDATILFEIASAKDYTAGENNKAKDYHKRRWMLWNMAQAVHLTYLARATVLVSPSSLWTRGYPREVRHAMAKVSVRGRSAKNLKDLREAQCMLWFHEHHPEAWMPLPHYLETL